MKRSILSLLAIFFLSNFSFAQTSDNYKDLIAEAWSLYEAKEYLESGRKYSEAFKAFGGKGVVSDRYNAACSWALAKEKDSAFVQLYKIADKGNYNNLGHLITDPDLHSLYADERWKEIVSKVEANKAKAEINFDKELVRILDEVYIEDQTYRKAISAIEKEHGWESEEMKAHWKLINEKDSINLIKVTKILDERGWLGADVIGQQGNSTLFLVIQHADLKTQEKYLPMMREAVKKGNAQPSALALLEDRVALRQGNRQIYGSQVGRDQVSGEYYVLPLKDPDNVDQRRAEVGLGPLQEYISSWEIPWDPEAYKKNLPEIEAKQQN